MIPQVRPAAMQWVGVGGLQVRPSPAAQQLGGRCGSERRPAAQQLGGVLWIGAEAGGRRVVAGRGGSIGWLLRSNHGGKRSREIGRVKMAREIRSWAGNIW